MSVKPNFFIVGAAKAGTTSLWAYLKENPQVFMPQEELVKEPGYFSDSFRSMTGMTLDQYLSLFKDATSRHIAVGEASTVYLTDATSARNLYEFNPLAKIIIILRNPADRAYSLYNWMTQEGYEYASSFKFALKLETSRKIKQIPNFWEPEYFWSYMYFSSGLYYEQVKRYVDLFAQNVMVIKFDDLKNKPDDTYKRICDFIGVTPISWKAKVYNPSISTLHPYIQFFLRKVNPLYLRFKKVAFRRSLVTKEERDKLLSLGLRNRKPFKLDLSIKKELMAAYSDDLRKLSILTQLTFSDWFSKEK